MKFLQIKISTKESGREMQIVTHNITKETPKTFKTDLGFSISKNKIMRDWHSVLVDSENGEVVIFSSIFCNPNWKDKAMQHLSSKALVLISTIQQSLTKLSSNF
jgi:hypothetical protein